MNNSVFIKSIEFTNYNLLHAAWSLNLGAKLRLAAMALIFFSSAVSGSAQTPELLTLQFTSLDGRSVDVSTLKGKIVLIDCWATWCGPCLQEMPHIKELYDKYHDKGFEVIGISMDESSAKERVKKLIKQKSILWPQRFEGKGFEEDSFRKQYDIKSLPTVFLLNKEGIIVDTNARGEKLEVLIKQYLNL
jgi:thiol-disulfide isomerase/thioredoxin